MYAFDICSVKEFFLSKYRFYYMRSFVKLVLFIFFHWTAETSPPEEEETEEDASEKKPKTKTVKETTYDWEVLNDMKAIWLRNSKEVSEEEYTKFYHSLAKVNGYI